MENNKLLPGEKYFQEVRTTTFRKEEYSYIHTGIIDEDGEMWTTTEPLNPLIKLIRMADMENLREV